jgi:hypothetical protein
MLQYKNPQLVMTDDKHITPKSEKSFYTFKKKSFSVKNMYQ